MIKFPMPVLVDGTRQLLLPGLHNRFIMPPPNPELFNAQLQERQSRLSAIDKETDIAALLKQTYIRILVLHERIKLQNESLARNEKALQDAKSLLAQGRALRVDTLRAYTSVKNLEPDLLKLSYAIEVGKQQLRTLTGLDSLQEIELTDSLILPETAPVLIRRRSI